MDIGKIEEVWEVEPLQEPPVVPVPEPTPKDPAPSK